MDRVFDGATLVFLLVFAAAGFGLGALAGAIKSDGTWAKRGGEAALLAFLGGFLAHAFISGLLAAGDNSRGAGTAIGWGFFFIPGVLDLFARFGGHNLLTAPNELLWLAAGVGAFTGMMDGIWRIHRWKDSGWLSYPLDVMWGLGGTTLSSLLHLINFSWGDHQEDARDGGRPGVHRYKNGFALKPGFAFTQGNVMSNLDNVPTDALWKHEFTHTWQNRGFGPLYVTTYVGWMGLMLIPGIVASIAKKRNVGHGIQGYCYFSNCWETWAYKVQGVDRNGWSNQAIILSNGTVIGLSAGYAVLVTIVVGIVLGKVWL